MTQLMVQIIISSFLDSAIFFWFNRKSETRGNIFLNYSVCVVSMVVLVMALNAGNIDNILIRMLVNVIFYIVMTALLFKEDYKSAMVRGTALPVCVVLAEFPGSIVLMIQQNNGDLSKMMSTLVFWVIFMIITRSIEIIFLNLVNCIAYKYVKIIRKTGWHIVAVFVILGYFYYILHLFMGGEINDLMVGVSSIVNIILAYVVFGGFFAYLSVKGRADEQRKEMELLAVKAKEQTECYEQINEYKHTVRKIYHDLKNHLLIAEAIKDEKTGEEYQKSLAEYFDGIFTRVHTGNEILDILIEKKLKLCQEKGIMFEANIDFRKGDFINLVDVCVIFGNIIDNAVEACERISDKEKKIDLFANRYEEFVVIRIKNPTDRIMEKSGKLITQKKDQQRHGLGLIALKDSLNKYDGSFHYDVVNNEFTMTIMIPIRP